MENTATVTSINNTVDYNNSGVTQTTPSAINSLSMPFSTLSSLSYPYIQSGSVFVNQGVSISKVENGFVIHNGQQSYIAKNVKEVTTVISKIFNTKS